MKRILPLFLILCLLSGCFQCKHKNISPATCTSDGVCQDCGAVITLAHGHTEVFTECEADVLCGICGETVRAGVPHTPGAAATCTEEQLCLRCGKVLAPVTEHTPSGEASCIADVVCTVCGSVLTAAAHDPGAAATCIDDQLCLRCGAVLAPPTGHAPGGSQCAVCGVTMALDENSPAGSYIHETVSGAHFHNDFDAYYSGPVLVCGDYAVEYFNLSENGNAEWAEAVNNFAARFPELEVSALLVPKSCAYNSPAGFPNSGDSQRAYISATYSMLEGVTAVDAMSVMDDHRGEYMFYRTDHHWTSLGAYYASAAFCRANGIIPRQLGSYETVVQTDYIGSLYYFASGYEYSLLENPDYTVFHLPKAEYSMTIYDEDAVFSAPMLNTSTNDYAGGFISGDNPLSVISTNNNTGRSLLIFKESYGNCFAPFMADYFDNVVVADMRYFDGSIADLVSTYGITHAVIMNNVQIVDNIAEMLNYVLQY